jgi:hypothetical protein
MVEKSPKYISTHRTKAQNIIRTYSIDLGFLNPFSMYEQKAKQVSKPVWTFW